MTLKLRDIIQQTFDEWMEINTEEQIKQRTTDWLNNAADKIIMAVTGLEKRYHDWEVKRNSPIEKHIQSIAKDAAIAWFNQHITEIPVPNEALVSMLIEEYKGWYREELEDQVRKLARQHVNVDAQSIVNSFITEMGTPVLNTEIIKYDEDKEWEW